jgi:peptide/nickel transport system permease protein
MTRYVLRRLLEMPAVILIVSLVTFALLHLTPGDPVVTALGITADPETIAVLRAKLGLDLPLHVQFFRWLGAVAHGDLGASMLSGQSVTEIIAQRIPITLTLAISATVFSIAISIPLGIVSAVRPGSRLDRTAAIFSTLGIAVPNFVIAIVLILVFGVFLRILPIGGFVNLLSDPIEWLKHLVLPTLALGTVYLALLSRMVQVSVAEIVSLDYVRTARAKGLSTRVVLVRHVLRGALLPVITTIAINFAYLLGGAIIIEQIFFLPGLGRLVVDAATQRDYTVVQGVMIVTSLVFLLSSLVADILFAYLDPRIRYAD